MISVMNIKGSAPLTILGGILLTVITGVVTFKYSGLIIQSNTALWPFATLPALFITVIIYIITKLAEIRGLGRYSVDEQRRLNFIVGKRIKRLYFSICYNAITMFILVMTLYTANKPTIHNYSVSIASSMLFLALYSFIVVSWSIIEIDRFRAKLDKRETDQREKSRILSKLNNGVG